MMAAPTDRNDTGEMRWLFQEEEEDKTESGVGAHAKTILGYTMAILTVLTQAAGAVCAQALGGLLPPFELNMWRFLAQGVIVVPIVAWKWKQLTITPQRHQVPWLTVVSVVVMAFNVFYFTASTYLPVGTLSGLARGSMVLAAALIALVIYREYSWDITVSVVVCVIGIVLVTQPEFIFGGDNTAVYQPMCGQLSPSDNQTSSGNTNRSTISPYVLSAGEQIVGYCMGVASGFLAAMSFFVINKKLQDMDAFVQNLWMGFVCTIFSLIPMLIFENVTMPKTLTCGLLLAGHALGAGGATVFFVLSVSFISPVALSIVMTLQVVVLFICQYTVMKSVAPGKQNDLEIVGAVVIFMGNVISPLCNFYATKTGNTQKGMVPD